MEAYINARPEINEWAKDEKTKIIQHFITYGHKEIDIRKAIQSYQKRRSTRYLGTAVDYFRNVSDISIEERVEEKETTSRRALKFSKTMGDHRDLAHNQAHIFAQNTTLIHLNSNSTCTWIPKNACSNIRFSIALANGAISSMNDVKWIHNNTSSMCPSNKEILQASFCFVILRNPFKRLLSFFLDKICHQSLSEIDTSYTSAQELFNVTDKTTFEDIVSIIWGNLDLIKKEVHIRPQVDFLIYKTYDKYYQFENFIEIESSLKEKINLKMYDVRDYNSIFTSKSLEATSEINHESPIIQIREYYNKGKKPIALNMFTGTMLKQVAEIYFNDILLYIKKVEGGKKELGPWISKLIML